MIMSHNHVTKKIAYVFINSECRGVPYKNAINRGKQAQKLFDEVFEFDEVHTLRNPSTRMVKDAIRRLKDQAEEFERRVEKRNKKNPGLNFKAIVEEKFTEQVHQMNKENRTDYIKSMCPRPELEVLD